MGAYLLDTHALVWWLENPGKLTKEARDAIKNPENTVMFSAASAWEMSIKHRLGKLDFPANLHEALEDNSIEVLPVTLPHALTVGELPLHHQDPFDRMLIAQARLEQLILVTRDTQILEYDVQTLEA